jgi:UDP-N-acetylglucosamine kinase
VTTAGSGRPPHALSQAEHDEIFHSRVIPEVLATGRSGKLRQPAPPSRKLQVTVFGGRPGSGKSMTKNAVAHLLQPDAAELSGDHLGTMHPRWVELLRTDDRTAGSAVYYDSRAWFGEGIEYCLANRLDFILDTAQDNPERSRALLSRFHERDTSGRPACYVRVIWVSTAQAMADLGVLDRYQQEREAFGGGRFVANPDRSYPGVLATAEMIDNDHLADEVYVYARGGRQLYSNVLAGPGRWAHPARSAAAIRAERERPWTAEETQWFAERVSQLAHEPGKLGRPWWPQLAAMVDAALPYAHASIDLTRLGRELTGYGPKPAAEPAASAGHPAVDEPRDPGIIQPGAGAATSLDRIDAETSRGRVPGTGVGGEPGQGSEASCATDPGSGPSRRRQADAEADETGHDHGTYPEAGAWPHEGTWRTRHTGAEKYADPAADTEAEPEAGA